MVDYNDLSRLYNNPQVLRVLEDFLNKYKNDERINDWYDMVTQAKGFVSSFYKGELEAIVIKVLSGMYFSGEYERECLPRIGNSNVASVIKEIYSHLRDYIVVPIYRIATGEADYEKIATSLGYVLTNKEYIVKMLKEEKEEIEEKFNQK